MFFKWVEPPTGNSCDFCWDLFYFTDWWGKLGSIPQETKNDLLICSFAYKLSIIIIHNGGTGILPKDKHTRRVANLSRANQISRATTKDLSCIWMFPK